MEACTGGANPCMTKNCISCQPASRRCMDRARKTERRGGVGLGQEKVAQTSWLTCWCTSTRLRSLGSLADAWVIGGPGFGRQAVRGHLVDQA